MPDRPEWGTLTIEVPDFLESTRDAINSVAEFLVAMLDIALAALQLVKSFLTMFLNPILSLLQQIIDTINALIQDIRQMGLYITGDWKLCEYPFDNLRGGYSNYERRMITRLTDRTDPTRPDVSGLTTVFGLFFYLSVDISEIQRLIAFIMRLIAFFKQNWESNTLPNVNITEVRYGLDAIDIMNPVAMGDAFKQLADAGWTGQVPQTAQVRFKTSTPNKNFPFNPFPANTLGPDGFIVTVSSIADGISIRYDKPQSNTTTKPSTSDPNQQAQPRDYGLVRTTDGKPIKLYGGAEMLSIPASLGFNHGTANGAPVTGSTRIYGYTNSANNAPIPIDNMYGYFQRTFYMDQTQVVFQSFIGEYSFNLTLDQMPFDGDLEIGSDGKVEIKEVLDQDGNKQRASTVYVRIAACNKGALNYNYKYNFSDGKVTSMAAAPGYVVVPQANGLNVTDIGQWSRPQRVTFPNANTAKYLQAVKAALVVLVLCRPDLITLPELEQLLTPEQIQKINNGQLIVEGTAKEECGLESLKPLLRVLYDGVYGPSEQWKRTGESPLDFRKNLERRINKFVQDMYSRTGPMPDVEKMVVENTEVLRSAKWGDILDSSGLFENPSELGPLGSSAFRGATILESVNTEVAPGGDLSVGLALNPWCLLIENADQKLMVDGLIQGRSPQMFEANTGDSILLSRTVQAAEVDSYLATLPSNIKAIYESIRREENGDILVPVDTYNNMNKMKEGMMEGSGDHSPVIYSNRADIEASVPGYTLQGATIAYARTILTGYDTGVLISEARIALGVAGGIWNRSDDGNWIAIRFFDMMPGIGDVLETIRNWIEAIKKAIQSIIDAIIKYIEWLEARIIELQQLIRRINALLQELLGFLFQVPPCSALVCLSQGTNGLLSDFVSAQTKPFDSPLAYGAGIAVVIPLVPGIPPFVYELLLALFQKKDGRPDVDGTLAGLDPPDGIPLNGLPGPPEESEDDPPDVL